MGTLNGTIGFSSEECNTLLAKQFYTNPSFSILARLGLVCAYLPDLCVSIILMLDNIVDVSHFHKPQLPQSKPIRLMGQIHVEENERLGERLGRSICWKPFNKLKNFDGWLWLRLSQSFDMPKACPDASRFVLHIFVMPDVPLINGIPSGGMPAKSSCCLRNIFTLAITLAGCFQMFRNDILMEHKL